MPRDDNTLPNQVELIVPTKASLIVSPAGSGVLDDDSADQ